MRQSAPSVAAPRRAGRPARSGTRDVFVLCAMAVVVLALGLGLHLQLHVNGQVALVAALVVWMALFVMHLAVRRAHALAMAGNADAAPAPAEREAVDLKRLSASAAAPPRRPRVPPVDEGTSRPRPPPLPTASLSGAPRQATPGTLDASLVEGLRAAQDVQPPRPPAPARAEERRLPEPGLGWDLRPGIQRAEAPAPVAQREPAPRETVQREAAPKEPALREPAPRAPVLREPLQREALPREPQRDAHSAGPRPAVFPVLDAGGSPAGRPEPALRAGAPVGAATDARTTEARSMQSIIDQLAKQLRAPAGSEPGAGHGPAAAGPQADTEEAIARSVEALKAASGAMRTAQEQGSSRQQEPDRSAGTLHPSVAEAVAAGGLEVYLDSILSLEDRKARHFEISVRVRTGPGDPVAVDDYALVQAGGGLRGRLDAAKLLRVARIAEPLSKRGLSASLLVGLAAESLVDDTFLDACAGVLKSQPDIVHQLVPSFAQGEVRAFAKAHWETLATLRENGLRFGIDRLADLAMDFSVLRERGFHYVKIDAGVLLAGMQAHDGVISALQVCKRLADVGLDLIVGRIDDDATLTQVGGLGVVYGQGLFFGAPRPVRIDLKAPHEAAA